MNDQNNEASAHDEPSEATEAAVDDDPGTLEERIVAALCSVFDPEIPVNIYERGLIYDVKIEEDYSVAVKMTLTSPHCPVAETLPGEVRQVVADVPGVASAEVEVVWDPSWNPGMMSEAAKLELGMF